MPADVDFAFEEAEVEETPPPARREPERTPPADRVRQMPQSPEAEAALLGMALLDGSETIARGMVSGIVPESFYTPKNRIVWEKIVDLYRRKPPVDVAVLAEELRAAKMLDAAGGFEHLAQLSERIPSTAQAPYFIEKLRELHARRELIRLAVAAAENAYTGEDLLETVGRTESQMASIGRLAREHRVVSAKPIGAFRYPRGARPDALLGNSNYLPRGGGLLFFSYAGVGKSSFIMGACMSWALGEPWFGLRCTNGAPLKSLIVQGEDFDDYVGMVSESFERVKGLGKAKRELLDKNCVIVHLRGVAGDAFFSELRNLISRHNPDLVVINPVYKYVAGNVGDPRDSQPFLCALDNLNRDCRFAWILTHHTGKPAPRGTNGKRPEMDDIDAVYLGMGGSPFANWPRCSMLIEPRADAENRFWLKLGKGKNNAGITREVDQGAGKRLERVTKVGIRYSTQEIEIEGVKQPAIAWEADDGPEPSSEEKQDGAPPPSRAGRKKSYSFSEFRAAISKRAPDRDHRQGYNVLYNAACQVKAISKGAFNDLIDEALEMEIIIRDSEDARYYFAAK